MPGKPANIEELWAFLAVVLVEGVSQAAAIRKYRSAELTAEALVMPPLEVRMVTVACSRLKSLMRSRPTSEARRPRPKSSSSTRRWRKLRAAPRKRRSSSALSKSPSCLGWGYPLPVRAAGLPRGSSTSRRIQP